MKLTEYRIYKGFILFFAGWGFYDFIHKIGVLIYQYFK